MEYWSILLIIVIGVIGVNYLFKEFNFFKRYGIIHEPPNLISMTRIVFRPTSFADFIRKTYNSKPDAKYFGFYFMMQPVLLLRDPELIKEMYVRNSEMFLDRRFKFNDDLLKNNLFSLHGQQWRNLRNLLSPSYTSSKMKYMFPLMSQCATDFVKSLLPADKSVMDMKDAFSKYTNDVIATCAFGIKIDSVKNPTNKFYVYGKEATTFSRFRTVKMLFLRSFPKLAGILNLKVISNHVSTFFKDCIKTTIATRHAENITRPDMLQLMMAARDKHEKELSVEDMTVQAFIFFFGGFETSSTTMCFAAHEIAANPDVQLKLRQEIDKVLRDSNGELTYEAINRLKYLDAVISETLRLYSATVLERICEGAYELPPALPGEKSFTIKKGTHIWAPVYAIHHDEKYYDEPGKFRPERFLNDRKYHNSPYYMPFGIGPRMCIANRFALLEVKVLLFYLLARFELKPCAKTTLPMKLSRKGFLMTAEGGFWLNVHRRNDVQLTLESTFINENGNTHF